MTRPEPSDLRGDPMTRVDFYVLPDSDTSTAELLACRLTEKIYKLGHQVYVHAESESQAQRFDGLLWTFRAGSFVPHALHDGPSAAQAPVLVGFGVEPQAHTDVLVNLAGEVPGFFSRFERVAELVAGEPEQRDRARQKFRFYRDRGYELQTHNL